MDRKIIIWPNFELIFKCLNDFKIKQICMTIYTIEIIVRKKRKLAFTLNLFLEQKFSYSILHFTIIALKMDTILQLFFERIMIQNYSP